MILTNRIAKHNVLAREDVATLMDLREALATVVTTCVELNQFAGAA